MIRVAIVKKKPVYKTGKGDPFIPMGWEQEI